MRWPPSASAETCSGLAGALVTPRKSSRRSARYTGRRSATSRTGRRLPRVDTLLKLASALAVPVDELIQGIEWAPPAPARCGSFLVASPG